MTAFASSPGSTPPSGSMAQNRTLVAGVAVSLVLHLLVLLLVRADRSAPQGAAAPRMLTATFASRVAAPQAPAAAVQGIRKTPEPRVTRPTTPNARATPAPVIATSPPSAVRTAPAFPAPEPAPPPAASEAARAVAPVTAPAIPAPRAVEPQAPATVPGDAAARTPAGADTGTLDQYRLALIGVARKYKRYPAQAMEKGWQGRVEVRLVIGANGMTQSAVVRSSSGHEILDNQALDMVKKAKPLTPIPASLRGREFVVDIPVIFDLQTG